MSSSPCPGVGIARAIRSEYPDVNIVAVDNEEDLMSAMTDPAFTSFLGFDEMMKQHLSGEFDASQQVQWDLAMSALITNPLAMYIP
jgi:hypothetical protein